MVEPGFWESQAAAQDVVQEVKSLRSWTDPFERLRERVRGATELHDLLEVEPDTELERELDADTAALEADVDAFELRSLLRGPDDFRDAQVEISAG